MKFGLADKDLQQISGVLARFPEIESALVFGSRALGNYKPGSDVDLALKGRLNPQLVSQVRALLNEELPLPYFFDVVDAGALGNAELKKHIASHGRVLYQSLNSAS